MEGNKELVPIPNKKEEKRRKEFNDLKAVFHKLSNKLSGDPRLYELFSELCASQAVSLRNKYGQDERHHYIASNYDAYFVLIGGSVPRFGKKFDFKGEDSIEKFLRETLPEKLGIEVDD